MKIENKNIRSIYFVGIKGVAMTALALFCKQRRMNVSGCDIEEDFPTKDELSKARIPINAGFDSMLIPKKTDLVVYTGAHGGRDNPVVVRAKELGIDTLPHGKALGSVMEGKRQIVAAGSHGKTTISAMVATILTSAKKDPSYAVGCGSILGLGAPGRSGKGDWFVAEGDEYMTDPGHDMTARFLWTTPEILIVSNIDFDHPDAYADLDAVTRVFRQLQQKLTGQKLTVVNIDDRSSQTLLSGENVSTYGFSPRANLVITHTASGHESTFFTLSLRGMPLGEFMIRVPGRHNVANAAAATLACEAAGLTWEEIRMGLKAYIGTKRRFEKLGESHGIVFYDDYAHHPREIQATLAAARNWYPGHRIIAIFQPHTYSRSKALLNEFGKAFNDADTVFCTDIYASSRETDTLGMTGLSLVYEIRKHLKRAFYTPGYQEVSKQLRHLVASGDIVLFMGAGDIYNWERKVMDQLTVALQI